MNPTSNTSINRRIYKKIDFSLRDRNTAQSKTTTMAHDKMTVFICSYKKFVFQPMMSDPEVVKNAAQKYGDNLEGRIIAAGKKMLEMSVRAGISLKEVEEYATATLESFLAIEKEEEGDDKQFFVWEHTTTKAYKEIAELYKFEDDKQAARYFFEQCCILQMLHKNQHPDISIVQFSTEGEHCDTPQKKSFMMRVICLALKRIRFEKLEVNKENIQKMMDGWGG